MVESTTLFDLAIGIVALVVETNVETAVLGRLFRAVSVIGVWSRFNDIIFQLCH